MDTTRDYSAFETFETLRTEARNLWDEKYGAYERGEIDRLAMPLEAIAYRDAFRKAVSMGSRAHGVVPYDKRNAALRRLIAKMLGR